ncbi:hypothetical protein G7078_00195 [Sphingomonas sinipercae]|uniref:FecR protein domain-containing protein n=1 Tax=Sphingomonas sinipercae TaxID=2714944 RepID=A0A6G7ZKB6_9SPHN|nr:FecR domain-containing protein [Sphingomonas sinipercae]QIL01369.1 hypothetical protein G7078_00195 [Sphingomonas sinipercae]
MSRHALIEQQAAQWLIARDEPDWSAQKAQSLEDWLRESAAHQAAYWRLESSWRAADRVAVLGHSTVPARRHARGRAGMALAASVAALVSLASLKLAQPASDPTVAALPAAAASTGVGGRRTIGLDDGSRVELNTATFLKVAYSPARRDVWLSRGEAYFDVAPNPARPFVVHAGQRLVTVLGTRFSVRMDGDKVTVAVEQGRVRVSEARGGAAAAATTIVAGNVAVGSGDSTLVAANALDRVENSLLWREGLIHFDDVTLGEAAAEFNRYNDRQIVVTDHAARKLRLGGTFRTSNIDAFARLLNDAYGLRVTHSADRILISD